MKEQERPLLHSGYMEIAVTGLLDYRVYTIVPNITSGIPGLRHECDLLCLSRSGYLTEVEIKISKSDLKRDFKKEHGHKNKYIQRLVYAVPLELKDIALELIPETAGLIVVDWDKRGWWFAAWERHSKPDKTALKPNQVVLNRFYRLGCMRIWSLKRHCYKLQKQYQELSQRMLNEKAI